MRRAFCIGVVVLCGLHTLDLCAQTGKIAGLVTDAATGEGLPGVNVLLQGVPQGAATDTDGYYAILNIRPGTYAVRASFVGYRTELFTQVRVSTGLTTEIDFDLRAEILQEGEAVVVAKRPIVQPDVSANVANIDPEDFEAVPVAGITEILDLQAGIEPGLRIRGGDLNEVSFVIDGLSLRTPREQDPFTNISYTSLEAVQVQTGGFNAEYGNVRSGLVNLTTKEPSRTRYRIDGLFRYRPAQPKTYLPLGGLPSDLAACGFESNDVLNACDTPYLRPRLDPEVRLEGSTVWDVYTQRQYEQFEGWNSRVSTLREQGFDVTVEDMLAQQLYSNRKDNAIQGPDYEADFTLGGPLLPGLGRRAGDPRLLVSYRDTRTAYHIPQDRDAYHGATWQGKVTANPVPEMKLSLHGMIGSERGIGLDGSHLMRVYDGRLPTYPWAPGPRPVARPALYSDVNMGAANVNHDQVALSLSHALGPNAFYELSLQRLRTRYRSVTGNLTDATYLCPGSGVNQEGFDCIPGWPVRRLYAIDGRLTELGRGREGKDLDGDGHTDVRCFGGAEDLTGDGELVPYCVGESPLGLGEGLGITKSAIDTSNVGFWTGKLDMTNQLSRSVQLKTGAELEFGDYAIHATQYYGRWGEDVPDHYRLNVSPVQAAAYLQTKLEFEGLIANLGIRADYFDANTEWWVFEPYDPALRFVSDSLDAMLPKEATRPQAFLSPRLGVSFPVTRNSKLYFNYGHFRQLQIIGDVVGTDDWPGQGVAYLGNPRLPMSRTVAYELGFDQNLLDRFLLRISGFYRDISAQVRTVTILPLGTPQYNTLVPWNYEDIRGFEITVSKNAGRFVRGFANYTYTQTRRGDFGYGRFFQNTAEMYKYVRDGTDYRQIVPRASPYARFNLIFLAPRDFGPSFGRLRVLGDWRASLLGEWRAGQHWMWLGSSLASFFAPPDIRDNVQWRDYWNWDLRLTKYLSMKTGELQLFVEVDNLLNRRHLFVGEGPYDDYYMWSLHLPEDTFDEMQGVDGSLPFAERTSLPYPWVPGDDQPGDFRRPGVPFQPIEAVGSLADQTDPNQVAWYWAKDTGRYARWTGAGWEDVPADELKQVLDTKAYIDMPKERYNTFLNPRSVRIGVRFKL